MEFNVIFLDLNQKSRLFYAFIFQFDFERVATKPYAWAIISCNLTQWEEEKKIHNGQQQFVGLSMEWHWNIMCSLLFVFFFVK